MSNLRIIYNNGMDRATSVAASTEAGSLAATNLLTDIKSQVWRSTSTTATLTVQWALSETVGGCVLPFTNLTSTATIRVRGYTDPGDSSPAFDTGTVYASPSGLFGSAGDWGVEALGTNSYIQGGVNTFAYGGGAAAYVWFPLTRVKKVVIDLVDSANTAGYIEASRLVLGAYFQAERNPDYNAITMSNDETTKQERSDSGDMRVDKGTMSRALTINFQYLSVADRDHIYRIMRRNGMTKPLFISPVPQSTDIGDEQIFQVYGYMTKASSLQYQYFNQYVSSVTIGEI
jgi:hypothetical protein